MKLNTLALGSVTLFAATGAFSQDLHDGLSHVENLEMGKLKLSEMERNFTNLSQISLEERMNLQKKIEANAKLVTENNKKVSLLRDSLKDHEGKVTEELKRIGSGEQLAEVLSDQTSLINRLTAQDAVLYANLSSLAYADFDRIVKENTSENVSSEIRKAKVELDEATKKRDQIAELRKTVDTLISDAISAQKSSSKKLEKKLKDKASLLKHFGIEINPKASYPEIQSSLTKAFLAVSEQVDALQGTYNVQSNKYIKAVQDKLNSNTQVNPNGRMKVVGIFHRNGGEFSGMSIYDEQANKLFLTFAGSKSRLDWLNNLIGWNAKASSDHGLLRNMNFHAGFLSHFEGVYDSVEGQVRNWLKTIQEKYTPKTGKTLEIVGAGHSLGGALSMLFTAAAKEMATSMGIQTKIGAVTFGAPNIVHEGSAARLNGKDYFNGLGNVVRIEDSYDPVPKVVFWKSNPGVTIQQKLGLVHDAANAFQMFGRNPHSSQDYYHAAEKVFQDWKNDVAQLHRFIKQKDSVKTELSLLQESIKQLSDQGHKDIIALTSFDVKHADSFRRARESYNAQLESKSKSVKKKLSDISQEILQLKQTDGLTQSFILSAKKNTTELKAELEQVKKDIKALEKIKVWDAHMSDLTDELMKDLEDINDLLASSIAMDDVLSTKKKKKTLKIQDKKHLDESWIFIETNKAAEAA